jgi:hypothetical protein
MLLVFGVTATIGAWWTGASSLRAVAPAAAACWLGGALAIGVRRVLNRPEQAFQALGSAIFVRMAPALGLVIWEVFHVSGLDKPKSIYYLLVFYAAALAIETWTAVPRRKESVPPTPPTDY